MQDYFQKSANPMLQVKLKSVRDTSGLDVIFRTLTNPIFKSLQEIQIRMGCVAPETQRPGSEKTTPLLNILTHSQVRALKLIYTDLSSRNAYGKIDYENFLLFFRKNGLWGGTLFKEFDMDHSDLLAENQFILGISKIYKSTEEQKAKLLFSHFSKNKNNVDQQQGVPYKDFVRMLYNYPKMDLREILHDQHFFEAEIKEKLVNVDNPYKTFSRIPEKQTVVMGYIDKENQDNAVEADFEKETDYFRRSNEEAIENGSKDLNCSLTFFLYDKKLNVKMTSIHALVRKFGEMIFKELGLSIKTGRILENQFISWVTKHPKLYSNYYGGFNQEVWAESFTGRMRYLDVVPQKESQGKYLHDRTKQKPKKVGLLYIKNSLIIHEPGKKEHVINIIYLEGLDVLKFFDETFGFGIKISHRNGVYPEKKIFFINEELTNEWMEALKYYRSVTLYQQFQLGKRIGAGKFSIVYECIEIATKKPFALKEVETYKLSDEAKEILSNEGKVLTILDHPSIPKLEKIFITKTHNYLVMELLKGVDLYEYVRSRNKLSEIEAIPIIKQIIKAIKYCQTLGIVHRDLKPDNIMLMDAKDRLSKPVVKILDFGFANYVAQIKTLSHECKAVGTPNYIAPELLRGDEVTQKIDNFSIGSITYFMLSGTLPFLGDSVEEVFEKTKNVDFDLNSQIWRKISANAKDFIKRLMTGEADDRMGLQEALKHKWITETIIKEEFSAKQIEVDAKKKKDYQLY